MKLNTVTYYEYYLLFSTGDHHNPVAIGSTSQIIFEELKKGSYLAINCEPTGDDKKYIDFSIKINKYNYNLDDGFDTWYIDKKVCSKENLKDDEFLNSLIESGSNFLWFNNRFSG